MTDIAETLEARVERRYLDRFGWLLLASSIPFLLAVNPPPSATLINQAAAFVAWGFSTVLVALSDERPKLRGCVGLDSLLVSLLLLVAAALAASLGFGVPSGIAAASSGLVAATAALALTGAAASNTQLAGTLFRVCCWVLLIAGTFSLALGVVQVFLPHLADGDLIARSSTPGRAVGNLRQPNHLSSLLLWSAIAAVWLAESRLLPRRAAEGLFVLFVFGVVLSASRTGVVGVLVLAGWGLLDKRVARRSRALLVVAPFIYALCWAALSLWARSEQQEFIGERRITGDGDLSSQRFAIWANTLSLIARHPWFGVGFGEFNFAWTLTPFPDRPRQFFDHAHNLPLHLIVELGIPLGTLVLALLAFALWRAFAASRAATGLEATTLRCAFMMVLMMALHSQFEYPLWYAYFLLPTALFFGLCLGREHGALPPRSKPAHGRTRPLLIAGMLVMLGGFVAVYDYMRVVSIFAPRGDAPQLSERIAKGQRSWFFAHHADYAAATTARHPSQVIESFDRATHYLLDARLMIAWARALAETGDIERARHVAQRLREFSHEQAKEFFAVCDAPIAGSPPPFQCLAPSKAFDHRDFR